MEKIIFLVSAALLSINVFAGEQGNDNGFEIKLFSGFTSDNYGTVQTITDGYNHKVKHDAPEQPGLHKTPEMGISLGNRWYLFNPGRFGLGIHARWLDFAYAHKDWNTIEYKKGVYGATANKDFIKLGFAGPGVIGTFYLNDKMAIDAYYNLVPTMVSITDSYDYNNDYRTHMGSDFIKNEDTTEFDFEFFHYFGATFRYKVFQIGLEYNIAKLFLADWGPDGNENIDDYRLSKYNMNNLRLALGFKF